MTDQVPEAMVWKIRERAAELVEQGWCRGSYFRDAHGDVCAFKDATSFCLMGALFVAGDEIMPGWSDAMTQAWQSVFKELAIQVPRSADHSLEQMALEVWNDQHTAADVTAALRGTYQER